MTASFTIMYDYGGSDIEPGTSLDTDGLNPNLRFKAAETDGGDIDTANPIPIPDGLGVTKYRSYWKQIYLYCSTAPDTQVDNTQLYSDGTGFGTGIALWAGDEFPEKTSVSTSGYEVCGGTAATSGEIMTNHGSITGQTDMFSFTDGSALDVTISEASNVIDAVGESTNYVVLQMEVSSNASSGDLADETLTFQYDEI